MIKAEIVGHSRNEQGDELISVLCTFPRIILAEVNTHRMLSKNTSSSRAIPYLKAVEVVIYNPFIPLAWQKNHPGMQGTEYLSKKELFNLETFTVSMSDTLNNMLDKNNYEYNKMKKSLEEKIFIINTYLQDYKDEIKTLDEWWLFARDKAVEMASIMYVFDVTKQLCNRLLEPFMWTTMLITGPRSGWDNFFRLRCPSYTLNNNDVFKSKKDFKAFYKKATEVVQNHLAKPLFAEDTDNIAWLRANKGQAEIHIMDLAEKIYDAVNESTPKKLKPGEWHIPFKNKIDISGDFNKQMQPYFKEALPKKNGDFPSFDASMFHKVQNELLVKISTAMAARTSYTIVGEEKDIDYKKMIELHDRLLTQDPPHSSPMEHCARAMSNEEYYLFNKGKAYTSGWDKSPNELHFTNSEKGWCRNFKGFIPYRHIIETEKEI